MLTGNLKMLMLHVLRNDARKIPLPAVTVHQIFTVDAVTAVK
jgi:hypothetical protein